MIFSTWVALLTLGTIEIVMMPSAVKNIYRDNTIQNTRQNRYRFVSFITVLKLSKYDKREFLYKRKDTKAKAIYFIFRVFKNSCLYYEFGLTVVVDDTIYSNLQPSTLNFRH